MQTNIHSGTKPLLKGHKSAQSFSAGEPHVSKSGVQEIRANAASDTEPLLNEYQLADWLGTTVAKVRKDRFLKVGIPYIKIGGTVRYQPSVVRAWLNKNTVTCTTTTEACATKVG